MKLSKRLSLLRWWLIFLVCLIPLAILVQRILTNDLGPDPAAEVVNVAGGWALKFLWLVLAITPVRILFKINWVARFRRMIGLYTLFYAVLHVLAFCTFILEWRWSQIAEELVERPYITVGALAFLLLLPLGITSYKPIVKRLGKSWVTLHRSVYLVAAFALIHITWQVRSDYGEVLFYAVVLFGFLLIRLVKSRRFKPFLRPF